MHQFFEPKSIAVVGAGIDRTSLGALLLNNIIKTFKGPVYPVNPNYDAIYGLRCYPSIGSVPQDIDLALVITPAHTVPPIVEDAVLKGVKGLIIESAGFGEVGEEGRRLEERIRDIIKGTSLRIWGPNCMGIVDVKKGHIFSFMSPQISHGLRSGSVSLVVQSGMLSAGFLVELSSQRFVGISKACSIGNRLDVDECDVLEYLLNDPETEAVALYLESIIRPAHFLELTRTTKKLIVLLRGGRTKGGKRAAVSHTASISRSGKLEREILKHSGIILAKDFQEMAEIANSLVLLPLNPSKNRVGIITFSGGAGILSTDLLEERGFVVPRLSKEDKKAMEKLFPKWMSPSNPVDLFPAFASFGPHQAIFHAFEVLVKGNSVDLIFLHYFAGLYGEFEQLSAMKNLSNTYGKPLFIWAIGLKEGLDGFKEKAFSLGIPVFSELSRAADCLLACLKRKEGIDLSQIPNPKALDQTEDESRVIGTPHPDKTTHVLDTPKSKRLLEQYEIPYVDEKIVTSWEEILSFKDEKGFPLVLKGIAPNITHKTEHGLVVKGIRNEVELKEAFLNVLEKLGGKGKVLVQVELNSPYELIVGFLRDQHWGPVVMLGMGGILVEFVRDVAFAPADLDFDGVLNLMKRLKASWLFEGARNVPPIDKPSLVKLVLEIAKMGLMNDKIMEIELNPVLLVAQERSRFLKPVAVDHRVLAFPSHGDEIL